MRRFARGSAARSVITLVGGTVIGQGITAGTSPIITRLYDSAQLGQFGLFTAFLLVASVTLSLRYETAVPTPRSHGEAARLSIAAMAVVVPMAALASSVYLWLVNNEIAGFGTLPRWTALLMMATLTPLGIVAALRYWQVRTGGFRVLAEVPIAQSLGRVVVQTGLGIAGIGTAGLLIGEAAGRSLGTLRLFRASRRSIREASGPLAPSSLGAVMRKYYRFPLYGMPSSVINALALYSPTPLIVHFYGIEAGGAFLLVQRVVSIPLSVVGAGVADVFHGRVAAGAHAGDPQAPRRMAMTATALFLAGLPVALLLIFGSRAAFPIVFGPGWEVAGAMAAAVAPWALAQFVAYPLSRLVLVYEAQRTKLMFDAASLLGAVGSLAAAAGPLGLDPVRAVGLLGLIQSSMYAGLLALLWRLVSRRR